MNQRQQRSTVPNTEVGSSDTSLKKGLENSSTSYLNKIALFEMEPSSDKSWELPSGLSVYVRKYMSHNLQENDVKEKNTQ